MRKDFFGWQTHRLPCPARVMRWGTGARRCCSIPLRAATSRSRAQGLIGALAASSTPDASRSTRWTACPASTGPRASTRPSTARGAEPIRRLRVRGGRAADPQRLRLPRHRIVATGASYGAFYAVASLCRHPDAFRLAIGMSGTYDLSATSAAAGTRTSTTPRRCTSCQGWARAGSSTRCGDASHPGDGLRTLGGPGRVVAPRRRDGRQGHPEPRGRVGPGVDHDWPTWLAMLPKYLARTPEARPALTAGRGLSGCRSAARASRGRPPRPRRSRAVAEPRLRGASSSSCSGSELVHACAISRRTVIRASRGHAPGPGRARWP